MKKFDLEKAKAGAKVVTRDGQKVELLKFDLENEQPIVGTRCNNQMVSTWHTNGSWGGAGNETKNDLVMAPEIKEGWVNVYGRSGDLLYTSLIYDSYDLAVKNKSEHDHIATTKITWEE